MIKKKWRIAEPITNEIKAGFPELDAILLQLLWNRGIRTQAAMDQFLHPDWSQDVHDPYLFRDMTKAVQLIYETIGAGETIGVYGDYDADGVCAAVIIFATLKKLGASVEVYLPHREKEGYGLNESGLRYLKEKNVKLIITCDCGIANTAQVKLANRLGLAVIITDHHQAQAELPPALAILHPSLPQENYPDKFLSGGGVAFKLMQGLLRYEGCYLSAAEREAHEKWLSDLVAISTVADMVKLQGENRTLVSYGLRVLRKTKNLGLQKIINSAGIAPDKIDAYTISWQIAPRINAAGRMDHANAAFALLISNDESAAAELAESLNLTNMARQRATDQMVSHACEQIGEIAENTYFVHAFRQDWPMGLVGLAAGKLVQIYNRPALVMCQNGDKIAGSGRAGIADFDLVKALSQCAHLLSSYGGHKEAAGFSLLQANYEKFLASFAESAKQQLAGVDLSPVLMLDQQIKFADLNWELLERINLLEPYGQGNPKPKFVSLGVRVVNLNTVGAAGQHLRLDLMSEGIRHKFIWFNNAQATALKLMPNDIIDVAYEIGASEWNNTKQLDFKVIDIKKSND